MSWATFWGLFVLASLLGYALLVVVTAVGGWRDLRHLVGTQRTGGKPTPASRRQPDRETGPE